MCGTFGFELDMAEVKPEDCVIFRNQVVIYSTLVSPIIREGDLYRIWDPFKVTSDEWIQVICIMQYCYEIYAILPYTC